MIRQLSKTVLGVCVALPTWSVEFDPTKATVPLKQTSIFLTESQQLTQSDRNYFYEIAFGAEYGGDQRIHKWTTPLTITIQGTPTQKDRATLKQVVKELEDLTGLSINYGNNGNVSFYFAPPSQFNAIEPNYRPGNMGFFSTKLEDHHITQATILIASKGITQRERSHLIREELTQVLGLMKDSKRYPDSIFYQDWTKTQSYSPRDKKVIRTLYSPYIVPGMTRSRVEQVLNMLQNL